MSATPIITLDHLKQYLSVRAGVTEYDARLTAFIQVASQSLENFTRRAFAQKAYTTFFNSRNTFADVYNLYGSGDAYRRSVREVSYSLPGYPVAEAEPVTVLYDPDRKFGPETELTSDDYYLDAEFGRIFISLPMRKGERTIKVTYTAGYPVEGGTLQTNAPEDLKLACTLQAIHLWNRSQPDNVGVEVDRSQGETASALAANPGGLCVEAAMLAAPYKRLLLGNA